MSNKVFVLKAERLIEGARRKFKPDKEERESSGRRKCLNPGSKFLGETLQTYSKAST